MYNACWQSIFASSLSVGNLPVSIMEAGSTGQYDFPASDAIASKKGQSFYRTNWKWFTALLACLLILLMTAYAGLILKYMILVPEIIGYASSHTLQSPYILMPTGGSTMSGLERTALLHDMPVHRDVCPDEPVGTTAFARADPGQVARLNRKR